MTISLPQKPNGNQYEDLIAATLRVLGYFVEANLVLREDGREVLELDVVATPTGMSGAKRHLYEAKQSDVGFILGVAFLGTAFHAEAISPHCNPEWGYEWGRGIDTADAGD